MARGNRQSTNPSGRHLGHFKLLFKNIDTRLEDDEREQLEDIQKTIDTCYCHIINYAITHCYLYKRWKQIHHVIILKVPGVVKIDKLHIIALYESDLNLMLRNKWRTAMSEARRQGTLHPSQYGGCPGSDCQSVTLNEEVRRDYSLLVRTPMGSMENDATVAYDRIMMPISSLAARGYRIHRNVVLVHATTLSEAVYKLRLSNKVAYSEYTHCDKMPIHGSGQ